MVFGGYGGKGELGEGFGDADDGFELADGDGDAGARVCGDFGRVDLPADGDEVGRELFAGFGGEAGRAASEIHGELCCFLWKAERSCLRFAIADVPLHLLNRDFSFCLLLHSPSSHLDAHHMSRYSLIASLFMLIAYNENHVETR